MAGRLGRFLWQGLAGLALVGLALFALSLVVGVVKWLISVALLLAVGFVAWRIVRAVLR